MTVTISAEGLGKLYRIGASAAAKESLRSTVIHALSAPIKKLTKRTDDEETALWALRDVSFEIGEGEIVGIIGRNGAGKSTLLKILARITEPTEGRAKLVGDVGSLLEVGTGFHPELTGRENVYLNGAILGLPRSVIRRRFDEIVAFAGVERFLDTPVKRYSSGMQVRLAFAVAAHLEPEILLIDEVLAVGDAEFQKRCLGRIEEIRAGGRTVIFVSHSMPMVLRLCPRVLLMDQGKIIADGNGSEVVHAYLESGTGTFASREWSAPDQAPGDEIVRLKSVRVRSQGRVAEDVDIRKPVEIEVEYWHMSENPEHHPVVTLQFTTEDGVVAFLSSEMSYDDIIRRPRRPGVVRSVCTIPGNFLAEGRLFVRVIVSMNTPAIAHVVEDDVVAFQVMDPSSGDSVRGEWSKEWGGVVRPLLEWKVDTEPG